MTILYRIYKVLKEEIVITSVNYYRISYGITPKIEQEIIDEYKSGEKTLGEIADKFKLFKHVVGVILFVNKCSIDFVIDENVNREYTERLHPCEMFDIIPYRHTNNIYYCNLGDEISWVTLCSKCKRTLGFEDNKTPAWYPKRVTNKTIFRDYLFKYVENKYKKYDVDVYTFYKRKGNCGIYYSKKNQTGVKYYSSVELKHLKQMEKDEEIIKFSRGPRIPYFDYMNDKETSYKVDFKVWYRNGNIKLIESKVFDVLVYAEVYYPSKLENNLICKIEVAEKYCKEHNFKFEFWTEKD